MDEYLFKNNAKSTLASGITNVQTTLSVQAGEGALFPNPTGNQYFLCTLVDSSGNREIIKVTTRSTDDFTVIVRGQEGTTPRAFSANDKVELRLTAAQLQAIVDELEGLEDGTRASVIDLNGQELILDADGDTSITSDSDDQIDIKIAGSDVIQFLAGSGRFPAILLDEQGAAPTVAANRMGIYPKALDGQSELYVREESSGDEILMTDQGMPPLPKGWIAGLKLSIDAGPSPDLNITAGKCRDTADTKNLILASEITKQLDVAWAAGDDAGGLFTGAIATSTWYHVFIIRKNDGTIDAGFDTDIDCANIPADYTEYRRIGSILTASTGTPPNIVDFHQKGDHFLWKDPPLDVNVTEDATANLRAISTPLDVETLAQLNVYVAGAFAIEHIVYISSPNINDEAASNSAAPLGTAIYKAGGSHFQSQMNTLTVLTDTSSQIRTRANSGSTTLRIATLGYIDSRGKDD